MDFFNYLRGELRCEDASVRQVAESAGTPCYVYSSHTVLDHYRKLRQAFASSDEFLVAPLVCYSVKANSNLTLMKLMKDEGAGFDVVSGGELYRARKVGAHPRRIVFAGVGKTRDEIREGLEADILLINVESEMELATVDEVAGSLRRRARVGLRINPDVDPKTHTYITTGKKENKFGIDLERAAGIVKRHRDFRNVDLCGLHVHIGSQITSVDPYIATLRRLTEFLPLCREAGCRIEYLDIGGGFGIWYKEKLARTAREIADALIPILIKTGCRVILEPGRFIVGNAGVLVTRVLYVKESGDRRIVICDAGMNDLIRPTLYGAYHKIWPIQSDATLNGEAPDEETWTGPTRVSDIVGPICETSDFFARERKLPDVKPGDLLCVFSAGAYGYSMSSNYNSHPRPAEVVVAGSQFFTTTKRETYEDLLRQETIADLPM